MKTTSRALLAGFLVVCTVAAPAFADSDSFAPKPARLTQHVHLIDRPGGNSVVIEQSGGLVVVDAAESMPAGSCIVATIRTLSRKPVKYLIYPHYRGDHDPGVEPFVRAWPHLVIVSTDAGHADIADSPMDSIEAWERLKGADLPPAIRAGWQQIADAGKKIVGGYRNVEAHLAALTFSDRLSIPDAETPVEVIFLGTADTGGDAVVWAPTEKVLYTGGLVVEPLSHAAADPASWIAALDRIAAYDFAYLIPGHGQVQKDRAYLYKVKATLSRLHGEITAFAEKGAELADIYEQMDFESLIQSFGRAATD